ncbi:MAG: preprotein translocase subunit SecE [Fimbriimonas sp.]
MVTTSMSNSGQSPDEPKGQNNTPAQAPRSKGGVPTPKMSRGPKAFLNEVGRELKKVSWPTKAETNRLTGVVLTVCVLAGAVLSGMGFLFGLVIDFITKGRV